MIGPSLEFLESVEKFFSVRYPKQFKLFCKEFNARADLIVNQDITKGSFITDMDALKTINARIGEEQWGDYEQAIASKKHPKDGNKLWGEILPFAFNDDSVFGFNYAHSESDKVHVWSVHTVVHIYPSFVAFITDTK